MKPFVILLSLLANQISFEKCGNGTLSIDSIVAHPFPFQRGVDTTVIASGTLDQAITSGSYDITISLGGFQLYEKSGDLCALDKDICPQSPGTKTITRNFTIPTSIPSGQYDAKAILRNDNDLIACYRFQLSL